MKKYIKLIAVFLCVSLLIIPVQANNQDMASEIERSLQNLINLGVVSYSSEGNYNLDKTVSKEEFSKLIVIIAGLSDLALQYQGTSVFSEGSSERWSTGYIRAAVEKKLISAEADGLFKPNKEITFAEAIPVFINLLGYSAADIKDGWPNGYIQKAKDIEITKGILVYSSMKVSREDMFLMLYRLLLTNIKGSESFFADKVDNFSVDIVLDTNKTNNDLKQNIVVTNKKTYQISGDIETPEPGSTVILSLKDNTIVGFTDAGYDYINDSVKSISQTNYTLSKGSILSLDDSMVYYYNGSKIDKKKVAEQIKINSSIVISEKEGEIVYIVIYNPIEKEPLLITEGLLGVNANIRFRNALIDKNGSMISPDKLEINDVVYEITDIWGNNSYFVATDRKVVGKITAILPNRISPESIEIDGKSYALNTNFPIYRINNTGSIAVGTYGTVILDKENKAIDILLVGDSDNLKYALLINATIEESKQIEDYGQTQYISTLLHKDGTKKVYKTENDYSLLKGNLVTFTVTGSNDDYEIIELTKVEISQEKEHYINKDDRLIDGFYAADNIVIFDLISNISGKECEARVINFSELPNGKISSSKIKYTRNVGDFSDVDIMFTDNIEDKNIGYGIVTYSQSSVSKTGSIQNLKILVDGKEYLFNTSESEAIPVGQVVELQMSGNQVLSVKRKINALNIGNSISALDTWRLKANGNLYLFDSSIAIYRQNQDGTYTRIGTNYLSTDNIYSDIKLYMNRTIEYGGRVQIIVIR